MIRWMLRPLMGSQNPDLCFLLASQLRLESWGSPAEQQLNPLFLLFESLEYSWFEAHVGLSQQPLDSLQHLATAWYGICLGCQVLKLVHHHREQGVIDGAPSYNFDLDLVPEW